MEPPYARFAAWQAARVLVGEVYRETRQWPAAEQFGLVAQTRRAAVSVTLNIAEGSARRGPREFRRHTSIALGSLAEVECACILAADLRFASSDIDTLRTHVRRTGQLLWRLHRSLPPPS
jgi:four helix bundle protein